MKDRWSVAALAILVGGIALIAYSLLTPAGVGTHGGMGGGHRTGYDVLNIVLAVIGAGMASGSGVFFLLRNVPTEPPSIRRAEPPLTVPPELPSTVGPVEPATGGDNTLILRLLNGDERTVFRSLVDAGGEQLQRDIVAGTKMSDAKVSRVLDRLEEKGLVVRERKGMGNVVRISVDRSS